MKVKLAMKSKPKEAMVALNLRVPLELKELLDQVVERYNREIAAMIKTEGGIFVTNRNQVAIHLLRKALNSRTT